MYEYRARILKIVDADIVDVEIDLGFGVLVHERIRLADIEVWELGAGNGLPAKSYTEKMLPVGSMVVLRTQKANGQHGRYIGDFILEDGCSLGVLLVAGGYGQHVSY